MKKRSVKSFVCFLLAMLVSASAWSATYVYAGPYYTTVVGSYTTSMRITGSFTTANPLPPNLSNVEIGPYGQNLVTSWSFSNGVTTFTNNNSAPYLYLDLFSVIAINGDFVVSTDIAGNLTEFLISLKSPANLPIEVDRVSLMVGTSPPATNTSFIPACEIYPCPPPSTAWGRAQTQTAGSFTTLQLTAIPTLSGGGVLLLLGLMAVSTALYLRRKSG